MESKYFYRLEIKYIIVDGTKISGSMYGCGFYENKDEIKKTVNLFKNEFPDIIFKFKAIKMFFNSYEETKEVMNECMSAFKHEELLNKLSREN